MVVDPTRGLEFVQKSGPDKKQERNRNKEAAPSRRMRLDAATREAIRKAQETRKKPQSAAIVESVQEIRREAAQAHVEIPQQLNVELQQQQADAVQAESAFLDSFKLNKNLPEGAPKKKLNKVVTTAELRSLRQFEKNTELVRTAATDERVASSTESLRKQIQEKRAELDQLQAEADKLNRFSLSSAKREQARAANEAVTQAEAELKALYADVDGESQSIRVAKRQLRDLRDKRSELVKAQNRKEVTQATRDRLQQRSDRPTMQQFMSSESRLRDLFGSLGDVKESIIESFGSADSKYENWSQAFEAEERVPVVREQYDAAVAEVVGDSQMAFIEEQIALTQDVIAERSGTDASLYKKYYDQVGSVNLEHLLGVEAGDGFMSQVALRTVTVDRLIKFSLTGAIGLSAGVAGAGVAVSGILGMRVANGAMFYARSLDSQKKGQLRGRADALLHQENTDADWLEKIQQAAGSVGSEMMKLLRKLRGEPGADPRPTIQDMSNDQLLASIGDMLAWSEMSGTRLASNVFKEHKPLGGKENRVLTPAEVLQALLEEYGSRLEQVRSPEGLVFVAEQVEGTIDAELENISSMLDARRGAAAEREPMMKLIAAGSAVFAATIAPKLFNAAREMAADSVGMVVDVLLGTEANAATFEQDAALTEQLLHADSTISGAGVHDRPHGPYNIRINGNAYESMQAAGYRGFNRDSGALVFRASDGSDQKLEVPHVSERLAKERAALGWLRTENIVVNAHPDGTVVVSVYDEADRLQVSASGSTFEEINNQLRAVKKPYAHETVGTVPVDTTDESAATAPVRARRSAPTEARRTPAKSDAGTFDESGRFVPSYMDEPKPGSSLDFDDPDFNKQLKDEGLLIEKQQADLSDQDRAILEALEGVDEDLDAADEKIRIQKMDSIHKQYMDGDISESEYRYRLATLQRETEPDFRDPETVFSDAADYGGEWNDYQPEDERSRTGVTWDNPVDAPGRMERVQDSVTNNNPKDPESVKAIAKILREDRQARIDAEKRAKYGTGDYDDLDKSTAQLRREARRRAIPEALQRADKKLSDAQERIVMGGEARLGEDYQADHIARTQRIEQFRDGNNAQINFGDSVDRYSLGSSTEQLGNPIAKVEFAPGSARDSVELYGDWNALVDQKEAEETLLKDNWEWRVRKGLQVRDQNGSVVAERPQSAIDAIIAEKRQEVLRLARLKKIQEVMYEQGLDKEYDPARINSDDPRLKLQKTSEYRAVQKEIRQLERAINDSAPILKE